jgi:predicted hotdog family 3-hydroxylacyl-ACP dehydratase
MTSFIVPTPYPDICSLIPHSGSMCLLDRVSYFDDSHIICHASSHRLPDNPLRHHSQLSAQTGIEYAAQAVAAHGSLLARRSGTASAPKQGMIAILTDVQWFCERLDSVEDDLVIKAHKLADLPQGLNYRFTVSAAQQLLLTGELIIALQSPPVSADIATDISA